SGAVVSFIFAPPIMEAVDSYPAPQAAVERIVKAQVTVKLIGGNPVGPVSVPSVPVLVPSLSIPVVAAFFRHPHYMPLANGSLGAALIVVPYNSVLRGVQGLAETLNALLPKLDRLKMFAQFAMFLLGVEDLANALSATPRVAFRSAYDIPNLNEIKLIEVEKPYFNIPGTD